MIHTESSLHNQKPKHILDLWLPYVILVIDYVKKICELLFIQHLYPWKIEIIKAETLSL